MVRDALRTYVSLASGLVDVPRQRAVRAARALVAQGEATAEQAGGLADDLVGASRANRDALLQLVRHELDRALARLGLATSDEVRELEARVHRLEGKVRALRAAGVAVEGGAVKASVGKGSRAKSSGAKNGAAKSGLAKGAPAEGAPAKSAPAKRVAAKSATAKAAAKGGTGKGAAGRSGRASRGGTA